MNIFRLITNAVLKKKDYEGVIDKINIDDVVDEEIEEFTFTSDEIVGISEGDFIDATDSLNIEKYKNNIRLLIDEAKKKGKIEKFVTIREDDIFPYDFKWRVASSSTSSEYGKCNLAYSIRIAKAEEMISPKTNTAFKVPVDEKKLYDAASSLDSTYGAVYMPSHFRSTKHFTINTPLGYTGTYNSGISAGRDFVVIDDISNFINSGYGYSADYMDAYLDITHEELPISDKAIIMISDDNYEKVMSDSEVREQLSGRRVIRYKGDESLAINMVLSEEGVLPSRPGHLCGELDDETLSILENSMRNLCGDNNLLYAQGHGNLNGKGGHFSDLYDSMHIDDLKYSLRLSNYLKSCFPEYGDKISSDVLNHPGSVVSLIGADRVNEAIKLFNDMEKKLVSESRKKYDFTRDMLSEDERLLFRDTVSLINRFYSDGQDDSEIRDSIRTFYHSEDVTSQVSAARVVNSYIRRKLDLEGVYSM